MESSDPPIRVTFVQPALARYRIPVFRELARRPGIELRVVYGALKDLPNVSPEGFQAIPRHESKLFGGRLSFQPAEWNSASRQICDVLVLRWSPRSMTVLPALLRARANGIPVVLWGHGFSKHARGRRRKLRRWLARLADAIAFYDPSTRDTYAADGFSDERLFVAINSLDNSDIDAARSHWLAAPERLAEFRQKNALDTGPVILFVSRLLPANRVDLLVEATGQLSRRIPGHKTVIVGNGDAENSRLRALADSIGAADNVVFVDGVYDELKLAPWFLAADVFCYPTNIGLSLIHAFWYGLPVVTSDRLAIQNPEIVALESGVNGLMYEHGNVASLTAALERIVTDRGLRESMSQSARRTVEERFTIPRMVDGLEAAIRFVHRSSSDDQLR